MNYGSKFNINYGSKFNMNYSSKILKGVLSVSVCLPNGDCDGHKISMCIQSLIKTLLCFLFLQFSGQRQKETVSVTLPFYSYH